MKTVYIKISLLSDGSRVHDVILEGNADNKVTLKCCNEKVALKICNVIATAYETSDITDIE